MLPQELEKILKHLPEPSSVEVVLYGDFDYSSIAHQVAAVIPGIKLRQSWEGTLFHVEDCSKKYVLEIYRRAWAMLPERGQIGKPERDSGRVKGTGKNPRRIDIHKVQWYLDDNAGVELTPWEVHVKYRGQEPEYIARMREEIAGTNVRLEIAVNI